MHNGHLRTAFELREALRLAEVRFLPTGNPPHREQTQASAEMSAWRWCARSRRPMRPASRWMIAKPAAAACPIPWIRWRELRAEFPHRSICLLLGMDAFLGLPNWHRWREILELAHVVVAHRPGWKAPTQGPLGEAMVDRGTGSVRDLHEATAGRIFVHAVTQLEISSTELRQLIARGRNPALSRPGQRVQAAARDGMVCSAAMTARQEFPVLPPAQHWSRSAVAALEDMKAANIKVHGRPQGHRCGRLHDPGLRHSDRHVRSIADRVVERAKAAGFRPMGVEGQRDAEWVLVDLNDVIVHVMLPRVREFYGLEESVGSRACARPARSRKPAAKSRARPAARRRRQEARVALANRVAGTPDAAAAPPGTRPRGRNAGCHPVRVTLIAVGQRMPGWVQRGLR